MRYVTWKLKERAREQDLERGLKYVEKLKKTFDVGEVVIEEKKIIIEIIEINE